MIHEDIDSQEEAAAFLGTTSSAKTMADGTLRVTVDFSPAYTVAAFTAFGSPGSAVAVARLNNSAAIEAERPGKANNKKGPYGQFAKRLILSGFFRSPDVWKGIGTDDEFRQWCIHQPSAKSGNYSEYDFDTGNNFNVAAHVRHLEHGGGTGIKPEYSAIPLTHKEHQLQHDQGESAIGPREWWDRQRIKHVEKWAYETLKKNMGYDSYTDIHPHRLVEWAEARGLVGYLPICYTNAEIEEHSEASEA